MRNEERWRGSITVEAAIVLPIFVIFVFTMIMITKLVYIHSLVQQGVVQTAKEMSTYSYILSEILQLDDIHGAIVGTGEHNIEVTGFEEKLSDAQGAYSGNTELLQKIFSEIGADPTGYGGDFLVGGLSSFALEGYKDLVNAGTGIAAKTVFPHYVKMSEDELDSLLILLGVEGGLSGIKIKGELPYGDSKTLDIIAIYEVNMEPPLGYFLNDLVIAQRASCVPWMGEKE